jgi:chemotaxis response regulator CheB
VLMTGMGEDGAAGLGAVQAAGGITIAQSPDTCVVDSMPRSAIARGFASRVVSLSNLAGVIQSKSAPDRSSADSDAASSVIETAGQGSSQRRSS